MREDFSQELKQKYDEKVPLVLKLKIYQLREVDRTSFYSFFPSKMHRFHIHVSVTFGWVIIFFLMQQGEDV